PRNRCSRPADTTGGGRARFDEPVGLHPRGVRPAAARLRGVSARGRRGAGRVPDLTRDPGRRAPARGAGAAAGHARPLAGRDVPGRPAARRGGIAAAGGRGRVPGAALDMRLDTLDWIVLALYGVVCVAIGLAVARRAGQGRQEFFLSGRRLSWWLLGVSRSEERRVGKECRSRWSAYH